MILPEALNRIKSGCSWKLLKLPTAEFSISKVEAPKFCNSNFV